MEGKDQEKMKERTSCWECQKIILDVITYVLVILLVVAVGWLLVREQQQVVTDQLHEDEISQLKSTVVLLESILQNVLESGKDVDKSVRTSVYREEREIIGSGSTPNIMDLVKLGLRGPTGPPGKDGQPGRDGRDAVNLFSVEQHISQSVASAVGSEMAKVRLVAAELPSRAGAVYIRWGRTQCPVKSRLISKGVAAGSYYVTKGGGSEYLCLPDDPEYYANINSPLTAPWYVALSGVEYETDPFGKGLGNQNAPCAYCQADSRPQKLVLPAKLRCPSDWTLEYQGTLMSQADAYSRMNFVCVDKDPEKIPGLVDNLNGALFYSVAANCASGQGTLGYCPPYKNEVFISCVVCSK